MKKIMKFSDIPRESNIVIKQSEGSGSKGVYLVFDHHRKIFDVMKSKMLDGWEHLELSIENDLQSKIVKKDKWIVEELLYENNDKKIPSRDLKFYCFYGRVALILEVCRYPEVKYCWWLSNGEKIKTGKYDKNLFDGEGFTQEDLQYVADVSKKIPAPFVRIDFLKTEKGLYLGEFTPRPGGYEGFSNYIDQFLGEYFLEAEGRLLNDLFNGKKFSEYKAFLEY